VLHARAENPILDAPCPMLSLGEKLRRERERRDTSLDEIADATQIRRSFLEALEREEYDALPGRAFGKLYIRAYAELFGFDPAPLLEDYDRELSRRRRESADARARPSRERSESARSTRRRRSWRPAAARERDPEDAAGVETGSEEVGE